MIKNVILALVLTLSSLGAYAQGGSKVGHVNFQEIILKLPERADAESKIRKFAETLQNRLQAMETEYRNFIADYERDAEKMTRTERETREREIMELQQRIQNAQQKAQQDLQKQEEELLAPMIDRVNKAIAEVAKEQNFGYILDSSAGVTLYDAGGNNIGAAVEKKLNL
ncbi:MAG: OmpH family outer membrane protein [Luteibaculaceae bacterium]